MKLPNGGRAVVDMAKLVDYCLNPDHLRGKHKARVFASSLGLETKDAKHLREALLVAAREGDAEIGDIDSFGQRYVLDFEMVGPAGRRIVRSVWIARTGSVFPRLATCYVL